MTDSDFDARCHRILMFKGGALGDFILTLPAIRALRNAWPRVFIELVGRPEIAELARLSGLIDCVVSIDSARIASYFVPHAELPAAETAYIRSFDLIVSCLHDPDDVVRSNLVRAGARRVLCIAAQVKSGHAIDRWLDPLRQLGIHGSGREFARLDLPTRFSAVGKRRLREMGLKGDVIAIHPGSGSLKKNWPLIRFMKLADRLCREGHRQSLFIVGEADEAIAGTLRATLRSGEAPSLRPSFARRSRLRDLPTLTGAGFAKAGGGSTSRTGPIHTRSKSEPHVPVLSGCSLPEAASILSACAGYVGNDSGITHLAAALGVPTVALFGPTDPDTWAPRGPHVSVVASSVQGRRSMASIRVQEVFESLQKTRACCAHLI